MIYNIVTLLLKHSCLILAILRVENNYSSYRHFFVY